MPTQLHPSVPYAILGLYLISRCPTLIEGERFPRTSIVRLVPVNGTLIRELIAERRSPISCHEIGIDLAWKKMRYGLPWLEKMRWRAILVVQER